MFIESGLKTKYDSTKETLQEYFDRTGDDFIKHFFDNLQQFPFYRKVNDILKKEYSEEKLSDKNFKARKFVEVVMGSEHLNFGGLPKGLLPFHDYNAYAATAFEEHLYEAETYAATDGKAILHFTVSPEHKEGFEKHLKEIGTSISNLTGIKYEVSYSFQKPETDTVAVTPENKLFRKADGSMLFRPGGHGALIENLNDVDGDVIFIKNIDNVLVRDDVPLLAHYKKILGGMLLKLETTVFEYLSALENDTFKENDLTELEKFLTEDFSTKLDSYYKELPFGEKKSFLYDLLHRPIRICGMVKNEGEPGGGPFWVKDSSGKTALQIIESAQVNEDDAAQQDIFQDSTHFNPVDVVCSVKDHNGKSYDLLDFVNRDLSFIASKTLDGKPLKALELPGLWNGAMAKWNTLFVEVPVETFNPVKTVNDLLKPSHQVK